MRKKGTKNKNYNLIKFCPNFGVHFRKPVPLFIIKFFIDAAQVEERTTVLERM